VRRRVLLRAVERTNERIAEGGGCEPLPDGLSQHALRRSFASWLVAEGEDPAYVMQQLGHTDPAMTLGLYAKALQSKRRRPHARRQPDALMGTVWALKASRRTWRHGPTKRPDPVRPGAIGLNGYRGGRIRTADLLLPKQARYQAAPRPASEKGTGSGPARGHQVVLR
jgi:integrase-like protein